MSVCRYLVRAFFSALKGGGALSITGTGCVANWLAKQASEEACGGANREGGVMEGGQGELEGSDGPECRACIHFAMLVTCSR
jgi:hypothetical protein